MFRVVAVHEHDINMDITFMEISLIINYTIRWEEDINIWFLVWYFPAHSWVKQIANSTITLW